MKDMEKQKFEREWRDAFNQAGISPPENLWTNIELDLEKAEGGRVKRKLVFYKLMAAASVIFAMCMAGAGIYYYGEKENAIHQLAINLADQNKPDPITAIANLKDDDTKFTESEIEHLGQTENSTTSQRVDSSQKSDHVNLVEGKQKRTLLSKEASLAINANLDAKGKANAVNKGSGPTYNLVSNSPIPVNAIVEKNENDSKREVRLSQSVFGYKKLPALVTIKKIELKVAEKEQDPFIVMMAKLEQREMELSGEEQKPKKGKRNERLWTSVGFAAGSFNSSNSNNNNAAPLASLNNTASSKSVTDNQSKASGTAYSVGLNVGTKVADRWVIQGGVNYLAQTSAYQANSVLGSPDLQSFRAASINELNVGADAKANSNKVLASAPYDVNNSLQFLSIPMQAGYVAFNHKLALQINAGVSTDLFLQNTIAPQSNSLDKETRGRGADSPYRPLNFSGLFGTELSYRFGKHYRMALNPGLRYPLNSIYKAETGISSMPLTMDVGMRFRYIFH